MNIEPKRIKIADLIDGYSNDPDTGVKGYGGRLDLILCSMKSNC